MKIYKEIEQGTDEWKSIRKGKLTASHAATIAVAGVGLKTYVNEVMAEFYSNGEKVHFSNIHTERGNELEDEARSIYSITSGSVVAQVGFIEYSEHIGCSPDGLIYNGETIDGMIEVKCPDDKEYFQYIINGESNIDPKYIAQIQMNLLITEAKWCDLVVYNPNYEAKSMCVYRILPDPAKFLALQKGFMVGQELMENIFIKYNNSINN